MGARPSRGGVGLLAAAGLRGVSGAVVVAIWAGCAPARGVAGPIVVGTLGAEDRVVSLGARRVGSTP